MSYSAEIFKDYFHQGGNEEYMRVHDRNQESYDDIFSQILPADRKKAILEIGCGAGQLLWYLKNKGYTCLEGVDIGTAQVDMARKMGIDASVIKSIPEFLEKRNDRYDLVIMNQVVEHIPKAELLNTLRAIRQSLKSGGSFVFITPNMSCLSGPSQRYADITHETGFTERSAYQVMRIAGYSDIVISGDYVKPKFRPKRMVWWILNRLWHFMMSVAYFAEKGTDRPRILSRSIIVAGKRR